MARRCWIATCWLAGIAFWLPAIIIHALRQNQFGSSRFDIPCVTVMPVITAALALWTLDHWRVHFIRRRAVALWMLLGIWMLGPLCMSIDASFSGGGFSTPIAWFVVLLGIPLFVPLTFMMSAYDGTILALHIATIWCCVAAFLRTEQSPSN